jgi:hypothetical protein
MQETSKSAVAQILNAARPRTILDAPCGDGWLGKRLSCGAAIDGVDLLVQPVSGYRVVRLADLDCGIPADLPRYDALACCEGLDQLGNPLQFLKSAWGRLEESGLILVTLPNVWYPESKLDYWWRGFFPSYRWRGAPRGPCVFLPKLPWSFPQLYLFLRLAGFGRIELHPEPLSRPKHFWERWLAWPQARFCARRCRAAATAEERDFWRQAGSPGSVLGRHLIVSARSEPGT